MRKILFVLAVMVVWINDMYAQKNETKTSFADTSETKILLSTPRRFYMGNGYDLFMFSSALFSKPGQSTKLTPLRFTGIVNIGVNFHYDMNKRFGLFTGLGLKNLGLIEKSKGNPTVFRIYSIGAPIGIKVGDLRNRNFVFGGGGIDFPFHFKVKGRGTGGIYSEWFSDMTPHIMPYVFLGISFDPGIIIKGQYYPTNFFNVNYEDYKNGTGPLIKPLAGYKANIFALSLSIDIHYNQYKIQEREYRKWKAEKETLKN